jgi:hypothetical protein
VETSASVLTIFIQASFGKTPGGQLFAVDFDKTNILPFALQDLAFVDSHDLAKKVGLSLSCLKTKYRGASRLAAVINVLLKIVDRVILDRRPVAIGQQRSGL